MANFGNQEQEGTVHGVVYDKSQLSEEEARGAKDTGRGLSPKPKVVAATVGAAATTIILFILASVGVEVSVEVGGAITILATFALGYVKREN